MVLIALVQHDSSLRACRAEAMHEVRGSQSSALHRGSVPALEMGCLGVCADPILELSKPNQVQPGAAGDGEVTPGGSSLAGFVLNEKSFLWCCHIGLPMGLFIRPFPTISGLGQRGPMEGSLRDPKALQHSGSLLTPVLQSPCKEIATTM